MSAGRNWAELGSPGRTALSWTAMATSRDKPRFGDRAKQKLRQRAEAFLVSARVPQEPLLAGAQVISGLSRGWALPSPTIRMFGGAD
jgi:hypothetical protein